MKGERWLMMKKAVILLIVLAIGISGVFSCRKADPVGSYKIGILVSQTGNYAGLGMQSLEGIQLITDVVNEAGGVGGRPLELVVYDDKSEVTEVALAAKQLADVDRVIAILEGTVTQMANGMIPVANELQVPAAGISGTALFDDQLGEWFFRPMGSEVDYAFLILEYMSQDLGISKYAALLENSGYGQGGKVFLPQLNPAYNLTITGEQYFDPGAADLTPQLANIKDSDAEAILVWGSSPTASMAIKQIKELDISLPILTTPAQAAPNMVQSFGEFYEIEPSVVSTTSKIDVWQQLPDDDPDKAGLGEYAELSESAYGQPPSTWNVLGAQMVLFLVDGLERSTPDPYDVQKARSELRLALENTKDLDLLSGNYTMSPEDHYGCNRQKLILVTYQDGRLVYLP
jgi:branched-chain amino acid transport system substrate-binding protein